MATMKPPKKRKPQIGFELSPATRRKLDWLKKHYGMTRKAAVERGLSLLESSLKPGM